MDRPADEPAGEGRPGTSHPQLSARKSNAQKSNTQKSNARKLNAQKLAPQIPNAQKSNVGGRTPRAAHTLRQPGVVGSTHCSPTGPMPHSAITAGSFIPLFTPS